MSHAPLPSLRSLWANGGAPGAFVRRDAALAQELERAVRTAHAAERFGGGDAFARLVARVGWSELLHGDNDAQRDATDMMPAAPEHSRTRATSSSPDAHAASVAPRSPFAMHTGASQDHARRAGASAADASVPVRGHGAPPAHTNAANGEGRPVSRRHSTTPSSTGSEQRVGAHHAASAADSDARADAHERAHFGGAASASGDNADARGWRRVGPIGATADPGEAASVAAILAAVAERVASHATHAGAHASPQEDQPAPPANEAALSPLARAVRRVEQRLATARRNTGDEYGPADQHADGNRGRVVRPRVDALAPRDALRTPPPALQRDDADLAPHRAVGMRGLAERSGVSRAVFFGSAAEYVDQIWPDTELDRMSALLDDAARREGVDLEEGVS